MITDTGQHRSCHAAYAPGSSGYQDGALIRCLTIFLYALDSHAGCEACCPESHGLKQRQPIR